jgi:transposase
MARVEIFQGQARRRWTDEEKRRLVAETFTPGATVHGLARRHGVSTGQLFTWRKQFRAELGFPVPAPTVPGFAAVAIAPSGPSLPVEGTVPAPSVGAVPGLIEIELPQGGRVRISGAPDPATVTAALQALVRR